jgi:hypothetical protein
MLRAFIDGLVIGIITITSAIGLLHLIWYFSDYRYYECAESRIIDGEAQCVTKKLIDNKE